MTSCAIELNDASIAIARSDGPIAAEPGCAIESGDALAFGDAARRTGDRLSTTEFTKESKLIEMRDDGA
ncbi:MAG: hypothetical protein JRD03_06200 [Deltaproteobacteria bacterium]|nr:hypothetical protein [Deltaproteobacteria bacterium]